LITVHLIEQDLSSLTASIESDVDVVVCDPPFAIGGPKRVERLYNRKKDALVGGYNETTSPETLYRSLTTHAAVALKPTGLGVFISGWTHYHTLRNAVDASSLTLINELVFPFSFGVYSPRRFVTSHYTGALVERSPGRGRIARHHLSANKQKPYSPDVIPFRREYRRGVPRYVNTLSVDLTRKLAWHLIPDGSRVVDLCAGACGFARGILATPDIKSGEVWCYDNNPGVLSLAEQTLRQDANQHGKALSIIRGR